MSALRNHFHSYLDSVRREGRYRIFTDLERHAAVSAKAVIDIGPDGRPFLAGCSGRKRPAIRKNWTKLK
jgi:hypothetical protein